MDGPRAPDAGPGALAALGFLVGRWIGEGEEGGTPLTSEAEGRWILDGTWLQVREILRDGEGRSVHEDLTLYRFDPEEGHVRVVHCLPGGWKREWPVLLCEGRLHWVLGPAGPHVVLEPGEDGWCSRVVQPGTEAPPVTIRYRPAER